MKRIGWIDDLKGLGIVLIVAGHVVATLGNMSNGAGHAAMRRVFDDIYAFHVPLFFFIAGLTFSRQKSFPEFVKAKLFRLMVPYFFWGGLCAIVYGIVGSAVSASISSLSTTSSFASKTLHGSWWTPVVSLIHGGGWPNGNGLSYNGVLWFLPVLFLSELLYFVFRRICPLAIWRIAITSVCLVYLGRYSYYHDMPYHIHWCVRFMPFIALGDWLRGVLNLDVNVRVVGKAETAIVAILFATLSVFTVLPDLSHAYWARWQLRAGVLIITVLAIAKIGLLGTFRNVAATSIGIMLFHKFPLVASQILIGKMDVLKLAAGDTTGILLLFVVAVILLLALVVVCHFASILVIRFIPWSLGVRTKNAIGNRANL